MRGFKTGAREMKTPKFWAHNGLIAKLLTPISWIYGSITQWRIKSTKPYHCRAKVICIGNITAGGVGKTPVAAAMAQKYLDANKRVVFLTRGYKSKLKNVVVDLAKHTPEETGDEARILAQIAPVIIAPNRRQGAMLAENMEADVIIMDDGFQNPTLYKDESWLVFDGAIGIGNAHIIPAGPLRETLKNGQSRATNILIMGEDKTGLAPKCHLPVYYGKVEALPFNLANKNVLAFAGIGHPQKFYQTLSDLGYNVQLTQDFADHYAYKTDDLDALIKKAAKKDLSLVTTEKDFVKLPPQYQKQIYCLKIRAVWQKA